jgi:acetyl-CoA carboxylase carboxyl transferase subunit alpha
MASPNRYRLPFETPIQEMEANLGVLEARHADARLEKTPEAAALADQIRRVRRELASLTRTIYANLTPWQTVQVSRCDARPQTRDYIHLIFDQFVELHGDRAIGDDQAMVTGFAHLGDQKLMFIGHQKGKTLAERQSTNFGCAHPEGYRKAILKMKMAAKFHLPVVCLIDTPGAYPGIGAEERGQASVIAESLLEMSLIDTPIVCVIIGEGGSGGALGIGIGDRVSMLEHSYYSVISPEGCATILWKGAEHAERAATALRMTGKELLKMGIIDEVIPEPLGGAHRDHREAAGNLKSYLLRTFREIGEAPRSELLDRRYAKYRKIGVYLQESMPD